VAGEIADMRLTWAQNISAARITYGAMAVQDGEKSTGNRILSIIDIDSFLQLEEQLCRTEVDLTISASVTYGSAEPAFSSA